MKKNIASILFSALLSTGFAQEKWCSSMDVLRKYLAENPEVNAQYLHFIEACEEDEIDFAQNGSSSRALSDTIYIPVVFHIVHNGDVIGAPGGENISDAQIISQIDALNNDFSLSPERFANVPDEFKSLSARTKIRFCLAQFDPSGNPTTGILRHNLGEASWDQPEIESQVKPSTIWDRNKYFNVWTVRPGGDMASSGVLAYAQFPPPFGAANTDGVVARYNTIGTTGILMANYDRGGTLTHEVGHWLGLYHIWGDDNGACNGSDRVSDTPNQGDQYFGCPTHPQVSCSTNDMFMNHMDYTYDGCKGMFTLGQEARMMSVLNGTLSSPSFSRTSLKTGGLSRCYYNIDAAIAKLLQPDSILCTDALNPIIYVKNIGQTDINTLSISYGIDGSSNQYTWNGLIPALNNTYITLPAITGITNGSHQFSVSITSVNGAPDNNVQNDIAETEFSVNNQSTGFFTPYSEDFESGFFPPADWTIQNPSNDVVKWKEGGVGGYGLSDLCIWIDNSAYTTTPGKRKDAFIMQNFDFSLISAPRLSFQYAYVSRGTRYDSLAVSYSLNCGTTWNPIWKNGGKSMATSTNEAETPFVPIASEWDSVSLSLSYLTGQTNVLLKFENTTGWGNALYVDNINITGGNPNTAITEAKGEKVDVSVFPNPASGFVTVKLPNNHPFTEIQINDALGRKAQSHKIIDPISIVNVTNLTAGVYTVTLQSNTFTQTEKLVVTK